jgi:hypothetical protein
VDGQGGSVFASEGREAYLTFEVDADASSDLVHSGTDYFRGVG